MDSGVTIGPGGAVGLACAPGSSAAPVSLCACGDEPSEPACWDQLLPCGCDDPSVAIYASASIFDALPAGHTVVTLGEGCWRRVARFRGVVPGSLRYSAAVHGPVGDSYPSCDAAPCPPQPCPNPCPAPNRVVSGSRCSGAATGNGIETHTWCSSGGRVEFVQESVNTQTSYEERTNRDGDVVIDNDYTEVERVRCVLRGEFRYDGSSVVWVDVEASLLYQVERTGIVNGGGTGLLVDRAAEFTGSGVTAAELSAALADGQSVNPPVSVPTSGVPVYGYWAPNNALQVSSACRQNLPVSPLQLCHPNARLSVSCDEGNGASLTETFTAQAGGSVRDFGNFTFTYNDDWFRERLDFDGDVDRNTGVASTSISSTWVGFPPGSGVVVEGDCEEGDGEDAGGETITPRPGGVGETGGGDAAALGLPPGYDPMAAQVKHHTCKGCGG